MKDFSARAGKKEGGWGEGIFARPRFSAAAEFRANFVGAPPSAKFLYFHKDRYYFCEESNPSKRFDLNKEQIGSTAKFLKPNEIVEGLIFNNKIINISLPIKVQLKITQAPPGIRGDRAQGGTKIAILETGAEINVPLFIKQGDIIEINTETGEYVRRI